jgi:short-subunit dehydrogenase
MVQFSRSLHLELEKEGVHVTAVCPGFTYSEFHDVTGSRAQVSKMPEFLWMQAERVAEEGYQAVMRNKAVHINGRVNKGIALAAKYLPDQLGLTIMRARSRDFREVK